MIFFEWTDWILRLDSQSLLNFLLKHRSLLLFFLDDPSPYAMILEKHITLTRWTFNEALEMVRPRIKSYNLSVEGPSNHLRSGFQVF